MRYTFKTNDGKGIIEREGVIVKELTADAPLEQIAADLDRATYKESWTNAQINDLPDSSFLLIESGGEKDANGKTAPRSLRHLPVKNADGKVDLPHLRNALSRLGSKDTGKTEGEKWLTQDIREKLIDKATKLLEDNQPASKEHGGAIGRFINRVNMAIKAKSWSIDHQIQVVRQEWYEQFDPMIEMNAPTDPAISIHCYVAEVLNDAAIVDVAGDLYSYPYTYDPASDEVTFGDPIEVRRVVTYAAEVESEEKEGRRHNQSDQAMTQTIHDMAAQLGADCPAIVVKEKSGRLRWLIFSASSYQDRDREFVSLKALSDDCDRMQASGQYGVLRWRHAGVPNIETKEAGVGLDLGVCDFSAMHGNLCVESGTFYDDRIGAALAPHMKELGASKGFIHPLTDPDHEGVYHTIYTFERSLLPKDVASNPFTAAAVIMKESQNMATLKDKAKELAALLGDESLAALVMQQAEKVDQAAQAAGVKSKEITEPLTLEAIEAALLPKFKALLDEAKVKEAMPDPTVAKVEATLKTIQDALSELISDQPVALRQKTFRASTDESTKTDKEIATPAPDPLNAFMSFALAGTPLAPQAKSDIPAGA